MPKMSTADKQGQIGNIDDKTLPELHELLERQEKLLKKQKFLSTLPDKGTKVKQFAETLRQIIKEREKCPSENKTTLKSLTKKSNDRDIVLLEGVTSDSDSLSACLERVSISRNEPVLHENKFINSYENVIKKADGKPAKRVFKPNSSLKISKVQDLPEAFRHKTNQPGSENRNKMDLGPDSNEGSQHHQECTNVKEESAVNIPDYKYDQTVLISVEESVKLLDEQKKKLEDLQTRQAAERLAQRLNVQMEDYNPEGTDMNYRVQTADTDSDDEPEMEGYDG